jgi:hypothetical protein
VNETLKTAANVATPLGLIGLVVALLLFAYYRYLRGQERQIVALPEADRARHVDLWYARVGLDISNLTREQKFDFVRLELERRRSFARLLVLTVAVIVGFCFVVAAFAYVAKPEPGALGQEATTTPALALAVTARVVPLVIGVGFVVLGYRLSSSDKFFSYLLALSGVVVIAIVLLRGFSFSSGDTRANMLPGGPPGAR